jgi:hypothetical protein
MPWLRTGTVSCTLNSTTVTGFNTGFIANSRVGDAFLGPDGRWYEVANIASDTALSILPAYLGATVNGGSYALAPMQGYVKESADALRTLVNQFGARLAALGTTGNYDILPVEKGGTGGANQADARTALGIGPLAAFNSLAAAQAALNGVGGYSRANALGVVSQSGGVPTGALMESGSTGTGQFWKYACGMMVCTLSESKSLSLTNPYGGSSYDLATWSYPAAFLAGTFPSTFLTAVLSSRITDTSSSVNVTNTSAGFFVLDRNGVAAGGYALKWLAIGRWF